jgi:hypothetical protein
MALKLSESPSVTIKEIDLSGVVPAVTSTTGALTGDFNWGPAGLAVRIGNEAELASRFGSPSLEGGAPATDFLSAAYFLKYSSNAYVSRVVNSEDLNAVATATSGDTITVTKAEQLVLQSETDPGTLISDSDDTITYFYELSVRVETSDIQSLTATFDSDGSTLTPVYDVPATGNTRLIASEGDAPITVLYTYETTVGGVQVKNLDDWNNQSSGLTANKVVAKYPGTVGNSIKVEICPPASFTGWAYETDFDAAPTAGEVHAAVIDEGGEITGTAGALLETFAFLSTTVGAKTSDGSINYVADVLNNQSEWVWVAAIDSVGSAVLEYSLDGGARTSTRVIGDYITAFDVYEDVDTIQVDFLIAPSRGSLSDATTITNALVAMASSRQDCVAVASPDRTAVFASDPTTQIVATTNTFTPSSYLIADNNFVKVYNKYEDKYEFIAAASSTAGVMAATDDVSAPWFSPAGARRGQYLGVTSLAFSPTKSQRDSLYRAAVNPIVNLPGQGIILFGDKTKLGRPSAFDRINVRRLFLIMERAIKAAGENVMFEFNDEFTRAEFVNIVEPFLREIKGRRGISDFRVVCDETNNTADVIDNNSFVASIFVKPARSINYVTLNFVATRTGVDFEEVVGIV